MIVKNIIIKKYDTPDGPVERKEAIQLILAQSPLAEKIKLRMYQAEEDPAIIVEKWTFIDVQTRNKFIESEAVVLGPWPEASHDEALGALSLDSDTEWEE